MSRHLSEHTTSINSIKRNPLEGLPAPSFIPRWILAEKPIQLNIANTTWDHSQLVPHNKQVSQKQQLSLMMVQEAQQEQEIAKMEQNNRVLFQKRNTFIKRIEVVEAAMGSVGSCTQKKRGFASKKAHTPRVEAPMAEDEMVQFLKTKICKFKAFSSALEKQVKDSKERETGLNLKASQLSQAIGEKAQDVGDLAGTILTSKERSKSNQDKEFRVDYQIENQLFVNSIAQLQLGKRIRFSLTTSGDRKTPLEASESTLWASWNHEPKVVQFEEAKTYILSKLYPNSDKILEIGKAGSPLYSFIFKGLGVMPFAEAARLDKALFAETCHSKKTPHNKQSHFFAFGGCSQHNTRQAFKHRITQELTELVGYLLAVHKVEFLRVNEILEEMRISFSFNKLHKTKVFYIINLGEGDISSVRSLVYRAHKGELSKHINHIIGNPRRGYIFVEVPAVYPKTQHQKYKDLHHLMMLDK